jgi:hemerythrin-like domain-containing protein
MCLETSLTALLAREHDLIREGLDDLEELARHARTGLPLDAERVLVVLHFCHDYLDGEHLRLEHELLYPAAFLAGGPADVELAGRLTAEHEESRVLLRLLAFAWEPRGDLAAEERDAFAALAENYCARLHAQLDLEERMLFRFAPRGTGLALDALARRDARIEDWRCRLRDARGADR